MTKEEILEVEPEFQKIIDAVLHHNKSGQYQYWHEVWSRVVKPMNKLLQVCGFEAKYGRLRTYQAYESMQMELEKLSTLK